uniref:PUM-HD domain-containing protein n=1 Tax=Syphacia muris TaxID=451379 RepID=A0A0N5AFQ2_9BILA
MFDVSFPTLPLLMPNTVSSPITFIQQQQQPYQLPLNVPKQNVAVMVEVPIRYVLSLGYLEKLANLKGTVNALANVFPCENPFVRKELYSYFMRSGTFPSVCCMCSGFHFVQALIAESFESELKIVVSLLRTHITEIAADRYGSIFLQKAFHYMNLRQVHALEIFAYLKPCQYQFIIEAFTSSRESFVSVAVGKFGCRSVESAFHSLHTHIKKGSQLSRKLLLKLGDAIVDCADTFILDEYGNFVLQLIFKSEFLRAQASAIIYHSILRKILEIAQDKFGSRILEIALKHSSDKCLREMVIEILDGYEPDQNGRDAVEVLMFHPIGNYVMQALLDVTVDIQFGQRKGDKGWFFRLATKIIGRQDRLRRLNSGKKLLSKVEQVFSEWKKDENSKKLDSEITAPQLSASIGSSVESSTSLAASVDEIDENVESKKEIRNSEDTSKKLGGNLKSCQEYLLRQVVD